MPSDNIKKARANNCKSVFNFAILALERSKYRTLVFCFLSLVSSGSSRFNRNSEQAVESNGS